MHKLSLYYLINSNDSVNIFDSTYRNAIIEIRNISPPRLFSRGGGAGNCKIGEFQWQCDAQVIGESRRPRS